MTSEELQAWIQIVGSLVLSWPVVVLLLLLLFRKRLIGLLDQFTNTEIQKARLGPIEIERRLETLAVQGEEAVDSINHLNRVMADSRLLELEITEAQFGRMFTPDQQARMRHHIAELQQIVSASGDSNE